MAKKLINELLDNLAFLFLTNELMVKRLLKKLGSKIIYFLKNLCLRKN